MSKPDVRIKLLAAKDTAGLFFRVWCLHRRTGIPFRPLLDAHLRVMDLYRFELERAIAELTSRPTVGEAPTPTQERGQSDA